MLDVLLLNADYTPVRVVDWQRAVGLLLQEKVRRVADYDGHKIRSQSLVLPWPAVVTLTRYSRHRGKVRFNRANVLARDEWRCQYCGCAPKDPQGQRLGSALTLDHVVPRAQSKGGQVLLPWSGQRVPVSSWENIVTACRACNQRKGARLPAQARMSLKRLPRRPSVFEGMQLLFAKREVPQEWQQFIPRAA